MEIDRGELFSTRERDFNRIMYKRQFTVISDLIFIVGITRVLLGKCRVIEPGNRLSSGSEGSVHKDSGSVSLSSSEAAQD